MEHLMPRLSSLQIKQFEDQGYLLARGILDQESALKPIFDDYSDILDGIAETMRRDGRLDQYDPNAPILERLRDIYQRSETMLVQNLNISFPAREGLPADTPICLPPSIFALSMNEALLDHVEGILGPEIPTNPIQHVRVKPPEDAIPNAEACANDALHGQLGINRINGLVNQTPWHQDRAVTRPDADVTEMVTVWIPLTECTEENGCLLVHPSSHNAGLRPHSTGSTLDLTIADGHAASGSPTPLPAQPGDMLLLHPHLQHASLPNRSRQVRRSLGLRYHRSGQPSGRALLPSFVARSQANPASECRDHQQWSQAWLAARDRIAGMSGVPPGNRWSAAAE
jgi:phytanoyl-CoA hydroxylase